MKVAIAYPQLKSKKGTPLLSQNRQFQWFNNPTYIYPLVPAMLATLLQKYGDEVLWLDGIAENLSYQQWVEKLLQFQPDLLVMETKTPVIKQHWQIIKKLKTKNAKLKIALVGDHVTALAQESRKHCPADYIISGGNYDLTLLSILKGIKINRLDDLPLIDRNLTKWQLYADKNGNYKYPPGTYIMSGRDCWWRQNGGCTFCSWTTLYPQFQVRSAANVLNEVGQLIKLGVKEIFDDTGTFPAGVWLRQFCRGLIKRGYHRKIVFGCNLRFGVLTQEDYQLMAKANFRFLLFGLESANQITLDKLNKGIKIDQVETELQVINKYKNLEPHVTCMVGYPWETYQQAQNTVQFTKRLFQQGLINSLQATIVIPYPGTKLFSQAKKNQWLKTLDWDRYDMREPILKSPLTQPQIKQLTRSIYLSALTPKFLLKKLTSIHSIADLKFLFKTAKKFLGQLSDFSV